ncbi:hypothetical protein [Rossellomorea arthrocnemi]|uniref:hypothetical protein n=1 Tax=Rossellomorea arthrocnemi TaxID=2769542 RepID=UPI00191A6EF6|nr:hypothetical protein [Rossellomorea arthrocnemi]
MLRDLLWLAEAKMSYDRGKQTGLWGLIGVGLIILGAVYWDSLLLPFFNSIGLVNLAYKFNLVTDTGSLTAWNVFIGIFGFIVILLIFLLAAMVLYTLFLWTVMLMFKGEQGEKIAEKIGIAFFWIITSPITIPVLIIVNAVSFIASPLNFIKDIKDRKSNRQETYNYMKNQESHFVSKDSQDITNELALQRLNRLYMKDDQDYLIGLVKEWNSEKFRMYILLPSPFYRGIYLTHEERYEINKDENNISCIEIKFTKKGKNELDFVRTPLVIEYISLSRFHIIVKKHDENIEKIFYRINNDNEIQSYTRSANRRYILEREHCRRKMKSTENPEHFESAQNYFEALNATHADVLELMYDEEMLDIAIKGEESTVRSHNLYVY